MTQTAFKYPLIQGCDYHQCETPIYAGVWEAVKACDRTSPRCRDEAVLAALERLEEVLAMDESGYESGIKAVFDAEKAVADAWNRFAAPTSLQTLISQCPKDKYVLATVIDANNPEGRDWILGMEPYYTHPFESEGMMGAFDDEGLMWHWDEKSGCPNDEVTGFVAWYGDEDEFNRLCEAE